MSFEKKSNQIYFLPFQCFKVPCMYDIHFAAKPHIQPIIMPLAQKHKEDLCLKNIPVPTLDPVLMLDKHHCNKDKMWLLENLDLKGGREKRRLYKWVSHDPLNRLSSPQSDYRDESQDLKTGCHEILEHSSIGKR